MKAWSLAGAVALTLGAVTPPVLANPLFGSAAFLTARDCSAKSASQDCVGGGAPRTRADYLGGAGTSINYTDTTADGSFTAAVGANPGGLPLLKGGTQSGANSRINVNEVVYQQFTFTGPAHTLFSLQGDLTFSTSGNDGLDQFGNPGGNAGEQAGEGGIFAQMFFMDIHAFDGLSSAQDIMALLGQDCTSANVLAASSYSSSGPLSAGDHVAQLKINQTCAGSDIFLDPGDTAVLVMALQTPSNRGGFTDSTHTFRSNFDQSLPPEVLRVLESNFVAAAPADLPEPASLALVAVSLMGVLGARRRR